MILQAKNLEPKDRNFVTDSWLKSYRTSTEAKYYLTSIYKHIYWQYINAELESSMVDLVKAEDGKRIMAYCVYEPMDLDHRSDKHSGTKNIIKYIYVPWSFRNKGLATCCLQTYSHDEFAYMSYITPEIVAVCKKNKLKHVYLPYLKRIK